MGGGDSGDYGTEGVIATGDNWGLVKLLRWPCPDEHQPAAEFRGHASHVAAVAFSSEVGASGGRRRRGWGAGRVGVSVRPLSDVWERMGVDQFEFEGGLTSHGMDLRVGRPQTGSHTRDGSSRRSCVGRCKRWRRGTTCSSRAAVTMAASSCGSTRLEQDLGKT